jgi:hypothetical protein
MGSRVKRILTFAAALALSVVVAVLPTLAQSFGFVETFDGSPPAPQSYLNPNGFDIGISGNLFPMLADHSSECGAPPAQHMITELADAVFICNNHLMTSAYGGYMAIYLTPDAMLDLSQGASVLRWDMSTRRTSARDWVDLVITSFQDNHPLSFQDRHLVPNAIHLELAGGGNVFVPTQTIDGQVVPIPADTNTTWNQILAKEGLQPDAARRDTFEVTLSKTRIKFCMPKYGFCWFDTALPRPLGYDAAVVQLNHRSYNPEKACSDYADPSAPWNGQVVKNSTGDANCPPNTWHWDNISINPAAPLTIIPGLPAGQTRSFTNHLDQRSTDRTVRFAQPAPANAFLRFIGWGGSAQYSLDGGSTWRSPHRQEIAAPNNPEVSEGYFDPIPAGTSSVVFRMNGNINGQWDITNISVWAQGGALPASTPQVNAQASPTPVATPGATASATATATPTAQPGATETPTPAATITATATATVTPTVSPGQTCVIVIAPDGPVSGFCPPSSPSPQFQPLDEEEETP